VVRLRGRVDRAGKEPEHAEDLLRGLDAAQTALNLTPDLPTAAFNRALALERLGLREAAIDAWESYRRVDPSSDWGREAASRLEKLRAIPVSRAFDEKAFEVACAGSDASAIEALVREHPQAASEALMSALGAWAELELAGSSEADAKLAAIERGAVAMKSIVGDPIVSDAVQEIRLASAERRRKLAEAHSTLVRGRVALDDARAEEAGRTLADAERLFERARSPYADLATLYRLSSTYFGNAGKHLPEIAALIARYPKDNVRVVGARARWLQGLTLGVSGRPFEAATALRDAADSLDGLRFASDATFVRFNEAVWWWTLGQTARAWTLHRRTFEQLDRILDPRRAQALMSQAAKEAEAQGFPQAALELQQVAAVYSRRHETAMDRCDGLIWLARAANRAGRDAVARQVAARARTALGEVPDPALHARLDAELSLVEGRLAVATTPKLAIEPADHAARWFERVGKENQLLEAYELRAEARARAGDVEAAAGDYRLALETAEKQRDRLDASNLRMSFFDSTWTLAREFVGSS
jgi:tetratricopeptide (TPR) repeat protein